MANQINNPKSIFSGKIGFAAIAGVVCLLVSLRAFGCRVATKFPELPAAHLRLNALTRAYFKATESLQHAPNREEFLQFLTTQPEYLAGFDSAADMLRSPTDGEEFVIHWGIDFVDWAGHHPSTVPVFAYEKQGKEGKRLVSQLRHVKQVSDDELRKMTFPPPYTAP
jgi:hypothetical protein